MSMENCGRWKPVKEIGKGGQGTTYLAKDTMLFYGIRDTFAKAFDRCVQLRNKEDIEALASEVEMYLEANNETGIGALKILHDPLKSDDKALARLENEVKILSKRIHPNIIRILDSAPNQGWFTTTLYRQGTLEENLYRFKGQALAAMQALRPMVEAVAALHNQKVIHRDIKPANIFLSDGELVLGDFGLVFFADDTGSRISDTYENVGSRDWMPPWAFGKRIDQLSPAFDVFSLGKVLWAMISGKSVLQLWYHRNHENDIVRLFPREPHMNMVNQLLDFCICEKENRILFPQATYLLEAMDKLLGIIRHGGDLLRRDVKRVCRVCGYGHYSIVVDEKQQSGLSTVMGFSQVGKNRWRILRCDQCGHVQFFELGASPEAWGNESILH